VIVGAVLLFLFGTGIIGSEPQPCEGCRVPGEVFDAISRDPVLLPLAGATNSPIQGSARCGDSGTQTGVWRAFKRTDRDTKSLINGLSGRASRLGWKVQEKPLALAWFGKKRIAGASVQFSVFVGERGAIEAGVDAYCTEK
jgi:hypothetical protein